MWKNNTLYFDENNTSESFDRMPDREKLSMYLNRVQETFLDISKEIDLRRESKLGFASILLSCSAIEALAKIMYFNTGGATSRFNRFCLNNLAIEQQAFQSMELYNAYRCGLAHEGRIKRKFSVSYETNNVFEFSNDFKILNPKLFQETFLSDIRYHFNGREEEMGAVVSNMFAD